MNAILRRPRVLFTEKPDWVIQPFGFPMISIVQPVDGRRLRGDSIGELSAFLRSARNVLIASSHNLRRNHQAYSSSDLLEGSSSHVPDRVCAQNLS